MTDKKTLGEVLLQMYRELVEKDLTNLNEMPPLKINSQRDVKEPLDGILLTAKPLANGEVSLTVEALQGYWAVMKEPNKPVITGPTRAFLTTKLETYTEFVMPVTIVGIPSTIKITIGTPPQSFRTRLVHKLRRRKP